jgi:hypothetical protein
MHAHAAPRAESAVTRCRLVLSLLEHPGSNLDGCRCHSDDGAFLVQELAGEEADVTAAPHHASSSEQAAGPRRSQKLDMQVCRWREVTGLKASNQRGPQRVVQHGSEKAALNYPRWVQERVSSRERHLDCSLPRVDGDKFPSKRCRRCRERRPAFDCVPERAFAFHGPYPGSHY